MIRRIQSFVTRTQTVRVENECETRSRSIVRLSTSKTAGMRRARILFVHPVPPLRPFDVNHLPRFYARQIQSVNALNRNGEEEGHPLHHFSYFRTVIIRRVCTRCFILVVISIRRKLVLLIRSLINNVR